MYLHLTIDEILPTTTTRNGMNFSQKIFQVRIKAFKKGSDWPEHSVSTQFKSSTCDPAYAEDLRSLDNPEGYNTFQHLINPSVFTKRE